MMKSCVNEKVSMDLQCESLRLLFYWKSHARVKRHVSDWIGKAGGVKHSQNRIGSVFGSVIFLIITPPGLLDLKEKQAQDHT